MILVGVRVVTVRERPCVAGVAGGVGTSLLAAAVGGVDRGVYRAQTEVAVLVCRSTVSSVGGAAHALQHTPAPPVLAVVADTPGSIWGSNTRNRLRSIEPHTAAIVPIPLVAAWRDTLRPIQRASQLLALDPAELSKPERALVRALGQVIDAVLDLPDHAALPGRAALPDHAVRSAPDDATPATPVGPVVVAATGGRVRPA